MSDNDLDLAHQELDDVGSRLPPAEIAELAAAVDSSDLGLRWASFFHQLRDLYPTAVDLQFAIVRSFAGSGQVAATMNACREANAANPANPDLLLACSRLAYQVDSFEDALPWLTDLVELEPTNPQAFLLLGSVKSRIGDNHEAKSALIEALRLAPRNLANHLEFGLVLMELGHQEQAVAYLWRAAHGMPFSRDANISLLTVFESLGRTEEVEAQRIIVEKLRSEPWLGKLAAAHSSRHRLPLHRGLELVAAYERIQRYDLAARMINELQKRHPNSPRVKALRTSSARMPFSRQDGPGPWDPPSGDPHATFEDLKEYSQPAARPEPGLGFHLADVAGISGLGTFEHLLGDSEKLWIFELMGSGVAVGDYDSDGDDDIYLVCGRPNRARVDPRWRNALFRNDGGTFSDVTESARVGDLGSGMCAVFGDIDSDGWNDIFVGNDGRNTLYRNRGDGIFDDVTVSSGISGELFTVAAAFADVDIDGDLDLYVANYVDVDMERDADERGSAWGMRVHVSPVRFEGQLDQLYLNDGSGHFTEVAEQAGINPRAGKGMGAVFIDLENDGDLDLYVANDVSSNFVLANHGDGTFEDVSLMSGGALRESGKFAGSMGVCAGDWNNDGLLDLHVTSFARQSDQVYESDGRGNLRDITYEIGISRPSQMLTTWGNVWADFDADGWLDILTANGGLFPQLERIDHARRYHAGVSLYRNLGDRFEEVTSISQLDDFEPQAGRGAAVLDFDSDGDLDVVINCMDAKPHLFENRSPQGAWLKVRLDGPSARVFGVRVVVRAGSQQWTRIVDGGSGYMSQSSSILHFGFGELAALDDVTVHWHHAPAQVVPAPVLRRTLTVSSPPSAS